MIHIVNEAILLPHTPAVEGAMCAKLIYIGSIHRCCEAGKARQWNTLSACFAVVILEVGVVIGPGNGTSGFVVIVSFVLVASPRTNELILFCALRQQCSACFTNDTLPSPLAARGAFGKPASPKAPWRIAAFRQARGPPHHSAPWSSERPSPAARLKMHDDAFLRPAVLSVWRSSSGGFARLPAFPCVLRHF